MEQLLRPGIAASMAAAVAGAGLIALSPAAPPALQHIDIQLTSNVFSELLSAEATDVNNIINGMTTVGYNVVFMPENLIIGGLAAVTGDNSPLFLEGATPAIYNADVLGALVAILQLNTLSLSEGVQSLVSLDLADAATYFAIAFDNTVLGIPGELVAGTLLALGL